MRAGIDLAYAMVKNEGESLTHKILIPPGENSPVVQLPIVIDEDGVVDERCLHKMPDGYRRTRQVCFTGIYKNDYFLDSFLVAEPIGNFTISVHRANKVDLIAAINILTTEHKKSMLLNSIST